MYSILTNREREVYELLIRNYSKGRAQAVVELLRLEELDLEQDD